MLSACCQRCPVGVLRRRFSFAWVAALAGVLWSRSVPGKPETLSAVALATIACSRSSWSRPRRGGTTPKLFTVFRCAAPTSNPCWRRKCWPRPLQQRQRLRPQQGLRRRPCCPSLSTRCAECLQSRRRVGRALQQRGGVCGSRAYAHPRRASSSDAARRVAFSMSSNIAPNLERTPSGGPSSMMSRRETGMPMEISCFKDGGRESAT